jgi:hypothetical protein
MSMASQSSCSSETAHAEFRKCILKQYHFRVLLPVGGKFRRPHPAGGDFTANFAVERLRVNLL